MDSRGKLYDLQGQKSESPQHAGPSRRKKEKVWMIIFYSFKNNSIESLFYDRLIHMIQVANGYVTLKMTMFH